MHLRSAREHVAREMRAHMQTNKQQPWTRQTNKQTNKQTNNDTLVIHPGKAENKNQQSARKKPIETHWVVEAIIA